MVGLMNAATAKKTAAPKFQPAFAPGAYRLDHVFATHFGPVGIDEPLTYLCHTPARKKEPARVRVECSRGAFYVDADRLVVAA